MRPSAPVRRGDEASGEESMLTPETRGRQRHRRAWRRMATPGNRLLDGWPVLADDATLVTEGDERWAL